MCMVSGNEYGWLHLSVNHIIHLVRESCIIKLELCDLSINVDNVLKNEMNHQNFDFTIHLIKEEKFMRAQISTQKTLNSKTS